MFERDFKFGVVILGAGASSRMGRPKLLLPWKTSSVLGHLLDVWGSLHASQVAVVIDGRNTLMQEELARCGLPRQSSIINPHPERGMWSSIQCAAFSEGWDGSLTHFVVTLGDQPLTSRSTLERLLEFASHHSGCICQPMRNGRARHPVVLPRPYFLQLRTARCGTLKDFLGDFGGVRAFWEVADAGLDMDLDTPEDYQRALSCLQKEDTK